MIVSARRLIRVLGLRFRSLFRKEAMDAELQKELAFHFTELVRQNLADGMPLAAARAAAARSFGNAAVFEEACRDQRRMGWAHDLCQDVRYAVRMLRKTPAFTAVAIASLALAIGGNTAILAAMDRVFLGRLPFPAADRLVVIQTFSEKNPRQMQLASVPDYIAWAKRNSVFETMGASLSNRSDWPGDDGMPAEHMSGQAVTASLFETLGVRPILGRVFTAAENESENPGRFVVISHRLWQRRYGGDPAVVNKVIRIDNHDSTVTGVMPEDFQYPNGTGDYWVPLKFSRLQLQGSERYFVVTARMKPGVSVSQAQLEMEGIATKLAGEFPARHAGWDVRVRSVREYWYAWTQKPLLVLETTVILMLLIACSNLATLLLARASARRLEMAARMALGASRGRLIRQMLTECILLSVLGGACGVVIAWLALKGVPQISPPPGSEYVKDVRLTSQVLALTTLVSILIGAVFGIGPAMTAFFSGPQSRVDDRGAQRMRGTLVTLQIGVALMLLIASGLLVNSVVRMSVAERHFDPRGILIFDVKVPLRDYMKGIGFYRGVQVMDVAPPMLRIQHVYERLRALPGVDSVAGISYAPVNSIIVATTSFTIEGRPSPQTDPEGNPMTATRFGITPNFFATIKTPFVRGRDMDVNDTASSPWVAIINEAAAARYWPGEDPIGKWITLDGASGERPRQIIGIVRNVPLRYLYPADDPIVYTSYVQQDKRYRGLFANMFGQMTFLVRSAADPRAQRNALRQAVADLEPGWPITNMDTMQRSVAVEAREIGLYAATVSIFGITSMLLAAIGVYGVTAYSVSQRTQEIGIRMALGATTSDIAYMISRNVLWVVGAGLASGLIASLASARLIGSQLWGIQPTDLSTFVSVGLFVAAVALLAFFIPARRATLVNPADTLRNDAS